MYCPRCGQQVASSEVRYCARCGLQLAGVERFLMTGSATDFDPGEEITPRQRGIRLGAKLLFASVVILPVAVALSVAVEAPVPLLLSLLLFFLGVSRMAYARLFQEHRPRRAALPPSEATTTGRLQPPSVTEHTTRMLDQ